MEESSKKIDELTNMLKKVPLFHYKKKVNSTNKQKDLNSHQNENKNLKKKLHNLEIEIQNIFLLRENQDQNFDNLNKEKMNLSKKLVTIENENGNLNDEIKKQKNKEIENKKKIERRKQPDKDALFVELMSGFNIKFYKNYCKIFKKNVVNKLDFGNGEESSNKIWDLL